jgi:hypothetical protein
MADRFDDRFCREFLKRQGTENFIRAGKWNTLPYLIFLAYPEFKNAEVLLSSSGVNINKS